MCSPPFLHPYRTTGKIVLTFQLQYVSMAKLEKISIKLMDYSFLLSEISKMVSEHAALLLDIHLLSHCLLNSRIATRGAKNSFFSFTYIFHSKSLPPTGKILSLSFLCINERVCLLGNA